ncbi:MAG: hypothetical protein LDL56_00600 [Armatimonadetes bacterium]|nr:hypothetical protein [Armatimonadota bacterium]
MTDAPAEKKPNLAKVRRRVDEALELVTNEYAAAMDARAFESAELLDGIRRKVRLIKEELG